MSRGSLACTINNGYVEASNYCIFNFLSDDLSIGTAQELEYAHRIGVPARILVWKTGRPMSIVAESQATHIVYSLGHAIDIIKSLRDIDSKDWSDLEFAYLSGPMDCTTKSSAAGWRMTTTAKLAEFGVTSIDPRLTSIAIDILSRNIINNDDDSGLICKVVMDDRARQYGLPNKTYKDDAGWDICAVEDTVLNYDGFTVVPTGLKIQIPSGYWINIKARSSASKRNILVQESVIDAGFSGEFFVCARSMIPNEVMTIRAGERIAQLIIHRVCDVHMVQVNDLDQSERGSHGWGSSGK